MWVRPQKKKKKRDKKWEKKIEGNTYLYGKMPKTSKSVVGREALICFPGKEVEIERMF